MLWRFKSPSHLSMKDSSKADNLQQSALEDSKEQHDSDSICDKEEKTYWTWIKRLNPFRQGKIPPVPEPDAGLVPETQAGWFSRLTWGWMTPLMTVFPILRRNLKLVLEGVSASSAPGGPLEL